MTLVSQIAPPVTSSGPAFSPSVPRTRPAARLTTDQALAKLISAASVRPSMRSTRDWRSIRCGLASNSARSRTAWSAGRIPTGRSTASRPGTATCSPIATAVQAATCQRRSPLVRRCQAGLTSPGEQDLAEMVTCIRLCLDCTDICTATAAVLSRPAKPDFNATRLLVGACAAICQSCGDECERHAHMPHCRVCAEACRRCDRACRDLLDTWH